MARKTNIPAILTSASVARELNRRGIMCVKVAEGNDDVDGEVIVSRGKRPVYVQVPTFGGPLNVGRSDAKGVTHWPLRTTWEDILADITLAMA